jgi:hypothetical protein
VTPASTQIPRRCYALVMLGATLAAGGLVWALASGMGADAATVRAAMIATGLGLAGTLAPVLLRLDADHWGLGVVGGGVARMLISLAYCYFVRETSPDGVARPLFLSVASGAVLLLLVEAVTSVRILSSLEHRRNASGAASHGKPA